MILRTEGEAALTWFTWTYSPDDLPRNSIYWDPQFATSEKSYEALSSLSSKVVNIKPGVWEIDPSVDLRSVGNTTIHKTRDGEAGHWHLSGGAITLAELFWTYGEKCSVAELMHWYYNAPKVLRKKGHPWGSRDCRNAATQRWKTAVTVTAVSAVGDLGEVM